MGVKLLEVKDLKVSFYSGGKFIRVVDNLTFSLDKGGSLGLVGESGCGKTVTAMAIAGLLQQKNCQVSGTIRLNDGGQGGVAMVFQDAMSSLNPVLTVRKHLAGLIKFHHGLSARDTIDKARCLLRMAGIDEYDEILDKYPIELSGGMAQRVCLALALCSDPAVLIADEPTTALDTLTGALVLKTLRKLRESLDLTIIMISHDLAAIAQNSDRLMIMYTGRVVETGPTREVVKNPLHPYTRKLIDTYLALEKGSHEVEPVGGTAPNYFALPAGCSFHPRCEHRLSRCSLEIPGLKVCEGKRLVACHAL